MDTLRTLEILISSRTLLRLEKERA